MKKTVLAVELTTFTLIYIPYRFFFCFSFLLKGYLAQLGSNLLSASWRCNDVKGIGGPAPMTLAR